MNSFSQSIKHTPGSFDYKIFFGVKVKRKSHDVSTSSRSDSQKYHRPLKFSLLMATYSIFILLLIFFQNHEGNENQLMMFSTKKIWKVTIFWLGMENGFCFEKTRLHLIANPHYVVLFLFQIHLFILLPNSCIVVSRLGLVSSLRTPHRETHG